MGLSRDYRGNDLLMRGAIGDIVAAGAAHLALEFLGSAAPSLRAQVSRRGPSFSNELAAR